ncbi:MAG: hypothetical protein HYT12_04875 [Candidatus Liptonbacteria bacterium]|nr:hypothetical protein [Candidatus Liptonbacteria bacterium]
MIKEDLKLALSLIKKVCDLPFTEPSLLLGTKHIFDHFPVFSLKDLAAIERVDMMYLQKPNSIAVSDQFLDHALSEEYENETEKRARRLFVLCHECCHALTAQNNTIFLEGNWNKLLNSKYRATREKGCALAAFSEGLATYVAVRAFMSTGNIDYQAVAGNVAERLMEMLGQMCSDRLFEFMSEFYGIDPANWTETLTLHYQKHPELLECGLERYSIGYRFFAIINPDKDMIARLVKRPPPKVRDLLYPLEYIKKFQ